MLASVFMCICIVMQHVYHIPFVIICGNVPKYVHTVTLLQSLMQCNNVVDIQFRLTMVHLPTYNKAKTCIYLYFLNDKIE